MFSVITPPNHAPQSRRSHKKSRDGCLTCKARRLKCDETKPICYNCSRHFVDLRACEYGSVKPGMEAEAPGKQLKPPTCKRISPVNNRQVVKDTNWQISLPKSIAGELLDPFRAHPPTVVKGVDFLMKHYLKTAVYTSFPWQPPSETNPTMTYFVPLVWSDTVLFHATLQLTFVRFQDGGTDIARVAGPQLMSETIRLLRERVEMEGKSVEVSVSDQTISAVAILAAIEHEKGDLKMLKMHMEGLRRMVAIRGGLNAIRETNPMAANRVFWMFVVAIYEIPFPSLDPVLQPFFPGDYGLMSPFVASHFDDIAPGTSDPPSTKYADVGLIQPVASVLISVQHISELVPTHAAYKSASTSQVILTRLCTLLSHLLSLPPIRSILPAQDCVETDFSASISECTRLAILLHVFTPWCSLPPDCALTISHLLHKLIVFLKELLANPMMTKNVLVLWIFSTGGVASAVMPERRWFVNHLRQMTDEMGIATWENMKAALSQGLWHEQLCERPHRLLWEEVVSSRRLLESP